jgi:hypothetical protein
MATFKVDGPLHTIPGYRSWASMWTRCTNAKCERFASYGGRGIKVCQRWRSARAFFEDMGPRPAGMTLGRVDNDGNYEPGNCRWEAWKSQRRNKTTTRLVVVGGEERPLTEWCELYGVSPEVAYARIHRLKWPAHLAVTEPVRRQGSGTKQRRA